MKDMKFNLRVYLQPAFLICIGVLAAAGGGMSVAIESFGVYLKKEPLPLKKSFDLLDVNDLAPYQVIKHKIENPQILKELGTEDYIQWIIEDPQVPADSSVRRCLLFVTYYRLPDRVPHVPEECYTGGGFQRLSTDSVVLKIKNDSYEKEIKGKYLVFGSIKANFWQSSEQFPVLYLFRINGDYAASRDEARIALNKNLFRKSSYFSKVEVVFNQTPIAPDKEQAIEASEKLLGVILPILEKEHWPDW